jgi:hypothetical protein
MKSALVHAGLLVAALVAALATWTQEPRDLDRDAMVVVWDRAASDVASVEYRSGGHAVDLERRGSGADAHLWGRESFPGAEPTVEEFPVADEGSRLFESLAGLRAIRDLGASDEETRATFGLDDPEPALSVRFDDGSRRTLVFGSSVTGGGARYALDVEAGRVYVLPAEILRPFEGGAGTLRVSRYQSFEVEEVETVTLRAGATARTMRRRTVDSPPRTVWVPTDSDRPDVAFGNFVDQMDRLWVTHYAPEQSPDGLELLLRADYADERGRAIGFLELYRGEAEDRAPRYFMRTPKTIVLGEIYAPQGERIEQDVESLFRSGATASSPGA